MMTTLRRLFLIGAVHRSFHHHHQTKAPVCLLSQNSFISSVLQRSERFADSIWSYCHIVLKMQSQGAGTEATEILTSKARARFASSYGGLTLHHSIVSPMIGYTLLVENTLSSQGADLPSLCSIGGVKSECGKLGVGRLENAPTVKTGSVDITKSKSSRGICVKQKFECWCREIPPAYAYC